MYIALIMSPMFLSLSFWPVTFCRSLCPTLGFGSVEVEDMIGGGGDATDKTWRS